MLYRGEFGNGNELEGKEQSAEHHEAVAQIAEVVQSAVGAEKRAFAPFILRAFMVRLLLS